MSNPNPYAPTRQYGDSGVAAYADESARAAFIRRTYTHLAGAVLAMIALEVALFALVPEETMTVLIRRMTGGFGWLIVLGAFMGVSWIARSWASGSQSKGMQYAGLALYVVAEAVIFLPILYIAIYFIDPKLPMMAGLITAMCFAGLTAFVFMTNIDLAPWGKYLMLGGLVAMGVIVAGICFGFTLGVFFSGLMVALACGYILYDTSNILHHYHTDQHVAASLALFASVAMLFYYVLRILMMFASDD